MFRSNKISLASANDIIDSLMESSEIMSGTGAVVITQKNGRKTTNTGAIYLRDGLIYAADIAGHNVPIGKRIETGALVAPEDLAEALNKVGGDTTSPRIVDYLLQNHMIGEKILSSYVKEHFIEILGKIMSWDDSLGEWHPNSVTKDFVMPFVTFDRIREILAKRKHVYGEFLRLTEKFLRPEELPELTFSLLKAPAAGQSPTTMEIISRCDSVHTINDISDATGVTFYNVFQTIVGLWRDGLLALNIGGIRLPYTAVLVTPEPEPVAPIVELTNPPIPVYDDVDENPDTSEPEPVVSDEDATAVTENAPAESTDEVSEYHSDETSNDGKVDAQRDENVVIIDPVAHGEEIPRVAADWAEKNGHDFHHFTQDQAVDIESDVDSDSVFYNPLKFGDATSADKDSITGEDNDPDSVALSDANTQTDSTLPEPIEYEATKVNIDSVSSESRRVLPKDILSRRNKVEEINNKLNQLEKNLADCEKALQQNQLEVEAIEERKAWLENELGEVADDYRRTLAEADKIRESYESIRKDVEDTINSFTFIEGE